MKQELKFGKMFYMKGFVAFLGVICLAGCSRKPEGCGVFRNGEFKTVGAGKTFLIERRGTVQLEHIAGTAITHKFMVDWVDDCTYKLIPGQDFFKTNPNAPKDALVTVHITGIKKDSYIQTSTANFSDKTFSSEVTRLRN